MKSKRNKPNYSMYIPDDLRERIDKRIEKGEYSSVAGFLIQAANEKLKS